MSTDKQQVRTVAVTAQQIMRSADFARGVADVRAGRHPAFDQPATNDPWDYERGRLFGRIAPASMPVKIGGKLNPKAVALFKAAHDRKVDHMINTNRNLTTIATEILARTQSIADVIEIGALLIEAQDHLEHGEWLPWVEHELDFSERSAQNYMAAHRFALKYATIADLKLTLGALYELASGNYYSDDEIGAVLAIAATERVTRERLDEIIEALAPNEDDEPSEEDDEEERRQWEAELAAANEAKEARAKEAAEAAAILDGPPPELPTTEEAPVVDHLTPAFTQAVEKLRELSTKPLAKFKDLAAMPDVVAAAEFLQNVVGHGGGGFQPIITAEQRLAQYAADERYEELKDQLGDVVGKFMWKWEASDLKAIYDSATNKERDQIEEMIYERHPEPKKNRARKTTQYEIEDGVPLPQGDVRP